MAIKPMLFNTEMVRAILEGRKICTRRVVKPRFGGSLEVHEDIAGTPRLCEKCGHLCRGLKPPCQPGDNLYVRETWAQLPVSPGGHMRLPGVYYYKADGDRRPDGWRGNWRPSIHMPKEAARIFLRVTDVRVERLQEMTPQGAEAEGVGRLFLEDIAYGEKDYGCPVDNQHGAAKEQFAWLWDSTIKPADLDHYGWDANPWVWVIDFERCERPAALGGDHSD